MERLANLSEVDQSADVNKEEGWAIVGRTPDRDKWKGEAVRSVWRQGNLVLRIIALNLILVNHNMEYYETFIELQP
ncbi:hypothetical protein J2S74_000042 [Evansella vedderi]|uniref:Uncharacterized protein n=1 Tax=Evansella vedderi TaxID=38282 RepID=A0ABT9ZR78_9BACI|nr:hypothetical protein [Evansella vedderi]MDQ0252670.1 hypothetical protein [Evansella vedderi]